MTDNHAEAIATIQDAFDGLYYASSPYMPNNSKVMQDLCVSGKNALDTLAAAYPQAQPELGSEIFEGGSHILNPSQAPIAGGPQPDRENDPYYNLMGAYEDLKRQDADPMCLQTIERVLGQIVYMQSLSEAKEMAEYFEKNSSYAPKYQKPVAGDGLDALKISMEVARTDNDVDGGRIILAYGDRRAAEARNAVLEEAAKACQTQAALWSKGEWSDVIPVVTALLQGAAADIRALKEST